MTADDCQRFSQAVLTLQECRSPKELSEVFLAAMHALCPAEGHTVNSVGSWHMGIVASTWDFRASEMEVFNAHLPEHPRVDIIEKAMAGETIVGRWSDRLTLREIRQTAIYQDFFRLRETRYQLAAVVPIDRRLTLGFAFNRTRGDFRQEDVRMVELLAPHVRQVMQRIIGQMDVEEALAFRDLAIDREAVMVVDGQGALLFATERARQLVRDYFPASDGAGFPLELSSWLRRNPAAGERLIRDQAGRRLICTCGSAAPWRKGALDEFRSHDSGPAFVRCLRFVEHDERHDALALQKLGLTPREAEVLYWMSEGKRNGDIATILQMSPRTVGKHAEHLFAKLNVETRAMAVALALEKLRNA